MLPPPGLCTSVASAVPAAATTRPSSWWLNAPPRRAELSITCGGALAKSPCFALPALTRRRQARRPGAVSARGATCARARVQQATPVDESATATGRAPTCSASRRLAGRRRGMPPRLQPPARSTDLRSRRAAVHARALLPPRTSRCTVARGPARRGRSCARAHDDVQHSPPPIPPTALHLPRSCRGARSSGSPPPHPRAWAAGQAALLASRHRLFLIGFVMMIKTN
eukprot:scaffold1261_cov377-Prasinococcus_capsulatus_cf.AAC.13